MLGNPGARMEMFDAKVRSICPVADESTTTFLVAYRRVPGPSRLLDDRYESVNSAHVADPDETVGREGPRTANEGKRAAYGSGAAGPAALPGDGGEGARDGG